MTLAPWIPVLQIKKRKTQFGRPPRPVLRNRKTKITVRHWLTKKKKNCWRKKYILNDFSPLAGRIFPFLVSWHWEIYQKIGKLPAAPQNSRGKYRLWDPGNLEDSPWPPTDEKYYAIIPRDSKDFRDDNNFSRSQKKQKGFKKKFWNYKDLLKKLAHQREGNSEKRKRRSPGFEGLGLQSAKKTMRISCFPRKEWSRGYTFLKPFTPLKNWSGHSKAFLRHQDPSKLMQ